MGAGLTFGSLACAIGFALLAPLAWPDGRPRGRRRNAAGSWCCWGFLLSCYGVCVGAVVLALAYLVHLPEWASVAIGLALGLPLFVLAVKTA
jgi:hypothetical protein